MKNSVKLFVIFVFTFFVCTGSACLAREWVQPSSGCPIASVSSVRASHILVDTKAEADSIKAKIDNGESFEALAKKYSKCPSGKEGGDLGYFERGQMVKEFEDSAFSLPIGKVSDPVKTQFGWHLIKVCDKK